MNHPVTCASDGSTANASFPAFVEERGPPSPTCRLCRHAQISGFAGRHYSVISRKPPAVGDAGGFQLSLVAPFLIQEHACASQCKQCCDNCDRGCLPCFRIASLCDQRLVPLYLWGVDDFCLRYFETIHRFAQLCCRSVDFFLGCVVVSIHDLCRFFCCLERCYRFCCVLRCVYLCLLYTSRCV